ncbi:hypothetical protein T09_12740 [Trichinella sp. T9]|nr:hypothetical protein T09_12740 [Trichinella sp. T9]
MRDNIVNLAVCLTETTYLGVVEEKLKKKHWQKSTALKNSSNHMKDAHLSYPAENNFLIYLENHFTVSKVVISLLRIFIDEKMLHLACPL